MDLPSVESTVQYVRMSFCPENVGNWSFSPQNDSEHSPRSIQSCFSLLQRPSCRKSLSTLFSIQLGQIRLQSPIGSTIVLNRVWPTAVGSNECWRLLFRFNWVKYDYNPRSHPKYCNRIWPSWMKKCYGFPQLGPWRSGKQLWIDLGECSDSFWGEEDQFPTFSGQNLMRTYWKILFQRTANPTQ